MATWHEHENLSDAPRALAAFTQLYASLTHEQLALLPKVYHPDIRLVDPVGEHLGLPALTDYFEGLVKKLRYCRFIIGESHINESGAAIFWQMDYAHPSLGGGKPLSLPGCSQLQFSADKVIFQQDYYDLGAMLYEQIPLIGPLIGMMKSRLKK